MKKYGDDADLFHNQGTRVEASKRWHEQYQRKHNYSYCSPSNSKSTYKHKSIYNPKSSYKYDSKYKRVSKSSYRTGRMLKKCPECGNLIPETDKKCSYCNSYIKLEDKPKSNSTQKYKYSTTYKRDPHEWTICSKCGHQYGSYFDSCPFCKSKTKKRLQLATTLIIIGLIAFILVFFLLILH